MKTLIIDSYTSVGEVTFDMTKDQVRKMLGGDFNEFKKNQFSKTMTDDFKYAHVYYDESNKLAAIEFFQNNIVSLIFDNMILFDLSYGELCRKFQEKDPDLLLEKDSFSSLKYGIGVYGVEKMEKAESIIVFKKG